MRFTSFSFTLRPSQVEEQALLRRAGAARFAYNQGLANEANQAHRQDPTVRLRYDTTRGLRVVEALQTLAAEHGATPAQLALAWLLRQRGVTCVLSGVRSLAQLQENLGTLRLQVPDDVFETLSRVRARSLESPYSYLQRE